MQTPLPSVGAHGGERNGGHLEPGADRLEFRVVDGGAVELDLCARPAHHPQQKIEARRHREREALEQIRRADRHRERQARLAVDPLRHQDGMCGVTTKLPTSTSVRAIAGVEQERRRRCADGRTRQRHLGAVVRGEHPPDRTTVGTEERRAVDARLRRQRRRDVGRAPARHRRHLLVRHVGRVDPDDLRSIGRRDVPREDRHPGLCGGHLAAGEILVLRAAVDLKHVAVPEREGQRLSGAEVGRAVARIVGHRPDRREGDMRPGPGSDHHHARGPAPAPSAVLHVRRRLLRVGHGPVGEAERLQREDHRPAGAGGGALDVVALDLGDGDRSVGGDPKRPLQGNPRVGHLERRDRQPGRGAPLADLRPGELRPDGPVGRRLRLLELHIDEVGALAGYEEAGGGRLVGGHVVGLQRVEETTDDVAALHLGGRAGRRRAAVEAADLHFGGAVFRAGARRGVMSGVFLRAVGRRRGRRRRTAEPQRRRGPKAQHGCAKRLDVG